MRVPAEPALSIVEGWTSRTCRRGFQPPAETPATRQTKVNRTRVGPRGTAHKWPNCPKPADQMIGCALNSQLDVRNSQLMYGRSPPAGHPIALSDRSPNSICPLRYLGLVQASVRNSAILRTFGNFSPN